jgi:YfiH family protein
MDSSNPSPETVQAAPLAALAGIRHAFFTRQGGHSGGLFASLNCGLGSGDDMRAVTANRAAAMGELGLPADVLTTPYQIHSARVLTVVEPWPGGPDAPQGDAVVTDRPGVALGILTADCVPVLFADADAGVVGAAHAGWKGAIGGVLEETVRAMEGLGGAAHRIVAAIGPCIHQPSYEVGDDFRARFVAVDAGNERFFASGRRPGHCQFDLAGYAAARLAGIGLAAVVDVGADTCADAGRFFSYRRSVLNGEGGYGRALSSIAMAT